jgi:hypothetical protein
VRLRTLLPNLFHPRKQLCSWSTVSSEHFSFTAATDDLKDYFDCFNGTFPLFDRQAFYVSFEEQYSGRPPAGRSWLGALNIVFAISCITATSSNFANVCAGRQRPWLSEADLKEMAARYFQNGSRVLADILFLQPDVQAIQTIIGMVSFLSHSLLLRVT